VIADQSGVMAFLKCDKHNDCVKTIWHTAIIVLPNCSAIHFLSIDAQRSFARRIVTLTPTRLVNPTQNHIVYKRAKSMLIKLHILFCSRVSGFNNK